ncbi:ANTAR domain-containing protein [Subtercola boreus]|uniref:ANTAR domain-containing protein n=1 Tax=Subtercola boreus TaxID=120213 RepID=A0A3E0W7I6_9MICO|nr:GAF and ANTAR domain-containing protein [Subtercola boreus]RFA17579.1 hypothetical protein B7R23_17145 [Subtercola boreus]RFA17698.1 hypothetical protein B7R24_16640 [Subtercola boreus]RFA24243.1 hypothetical protein B7R25_17110 [Subtercola boreus]
MNVEQAAAAILHTIHADTRPDADPPAQRLVNECAHATSAAGTSLTWSVTHSAPLTIAATEGTGHALELIGFILGEGPQISCAETNRIVLRPHLGDSNTEWPGFTPEALHVGVKAAFAFPLRLGAISLGALTLYRNHPGTLSEDHLTTVLAYAAAATALLLDKSATETLHGDTIDVLPPILEDPFTLQADVHQATGMLSAQLKTDLGTALSLLRAHAYSNTKPLTSVARAVIARKLFITWDTSNFQSPDGTENS